jgi:Ca2+-binding EF-hand superfamily protein
MRKLIIAAIAIGLAAAPAHAQDGRAKMFAKFDANSDGQLNESEVTAMLKVRAEKKGDPSLAEEKKVKRFIKRLDTDANGMVSLAEMQAGAEAAKPSASAGEAE